MMCGAMQVILIFVAALVDPCFATTTTMPAINPVYDIDPCASVAALFMQVPCTAPSVPKTTTQAASPSGFLAPQTGVEVIVEEATTTPMADPGAELGNSAVSHSESMENPQSTPTELEMDMEMEMANPSTTTPIENLATGFGITAPAPSTSGVLAPQVGVDVIVEEATTTPMADPTTITTTTTTTTRTTSTMTTTTLTTTTTTTRPIANTLTEVGTLGASHSVHPSSHEGTTKSVAQERPDGIRDIDMRAKHDEVAGSAAVSAQTLLPHSNHTHVHVVEASSAQARQKQVQDSSHGGVALKFMDKPESTVTDASALDSHGHGSVVAASRGHVVHEQYNHMVSFVCILVLVICCLGSVVVLICANYHKQSPARIIDSTKVAPEHALSTSPLLFRDVTRESTVPSQLDDDKKRTESDLTSLPQLPTDISDPEVPTAQNGVPLIWETTNGERTVYATRRPLGVQFRAEFPLKVKREPVGHGKDLGIEVGWILKCVNGIDVTAMTDMGKVNEILYREVGEKTLSVEQWNDALAKSALSAPSKGIPLTWDTPKGPRTVYATKKPLGVQFSAEFPLKIKRNPVGHGKDLGLEVGWILTSVNGIDVTAMTDVSKVSEILYSEVGVKTVPVEQWTK